MQTYINWKGPQGRETVDEVRREDFASLAEYRAEVKRIPAEYRMAGMDVYTSSRMCANWKD